MYWSRTGSFIDLFAWLVLCSLWWIGGWLLGRNVFQLRGRERLFIGLAVGWLLSIVFSNILAQLLPLTAAYWGASFLVLALGLVSLLHSKHFS